MAKKKTEVAKSLVSIQQKHGYGIRSPKKKVEKLNKELRKLRQPIYNLNRKLKDESLSKYKKSKIRKQIKEYKSSISERESAITGTKKDFRQLIKAKEYLSKEKAAVARRIKKIDKLLDQADENQDWKSFEKLSNDKVRELQYLNQLKEASGVELNKVDITGYAPDDELDSKGFSEDPDNPYTVWEAVKKIEEDLNSGIWKFMIINGKRISIGNHNLILAESISMRFRASAKTSNTPYVLRFVNYTSKTVKYTEFL